VPEANLVFGMKWLQGVYTQRFNGRHRLFGHLFQGRYKALVVEPEGDYFGTVGNYIHLNPVRARLVAAKAGALEQFPGLSSSSSATPEVAGNGGLVVVCGHRKG